MKINSSIAAQIWALKETGEVGPRIFRALMTRFNSISAIHKAELDELTAIEGLDEETSQKIFDACNYLDKANEFIKSLADIKIEHCTIFDEDYPEIFEELNDPPPLIFYRGALPVKNEKTAAIVGSHKATGEGIAYAVEMAQKLAEKSVSIVSGLAGGIDSAAHIGAIKGKGKTYAILDSGLENVYPEDSRPLAIEIRKCGALISEYAPDTIYSESELPARNRLIAGLSQAVIIGEIFPDSTGTLDTARFCQELGKLMFVLIDGCEAPGRDNSAVEKVLEWGAIPVRLDDDIDMIVKSLV